jgi:hypothetical protein
MSAPVFGQSFAVRRRDRLRLLHEIGDDSGARGDAGGPQAFLRGGSVDGARGADRMWVVMLTTQPIIRILERSLREIAKVRWNPASVGLRSTKPAHSSVRRFVESSDALQILGVRAFFVRLCL